MHKLDGPAARRERSWLRRWGPLLGHGRLSLLSLAVGLALLAVGVGRGDDPPDDAAWALARARELLRAGAPGSALVLAEHVKPRTGADRYVMARSVDGLVRTSRDVARARSGVQLLEWSKQSSAFVVGTTAGFEVVTFAGGASAAQRFHGDSEAVTAVSWSADGSTFVLGDKAGSVLQCRMSPTAGASKLGKLPGSIRLIDVDDLQHTVHVLDSAGNRAGWSGSGDELSTGDPLSVNLGLRGWRLASSPSVLVVGGEGEILCTGWEGSVLWRDRLGRLVTNAAYSRSRGVVGGLVWSTTVPAGGTGPNQEVVLLDVASEARARRTIGQVWSLKDTPVVVLDDEDALCVSKATGTVYQLRMDSGALVRVIPGTGSQVFSWAVSPGGRLLFLGRASGTISCYDLTTGDLLEERVLFADSGERVLCVSPSPDERWLACGTESGKLALLKTGCTADELREAATIARKAAIVTWSGHVPTNPGR